MIAATGLPATELALIEKREADGSTKWWFEHRRDREALLASLDIVNIWQYTT